MSKKLCLAIVFVLASGKVGNATTSYIGCTGVDWDTTGKVSWRASATYGTRTFDYALNGIGIQGDGTVHGNMIFGDPPPTPGQGGTITMANTSILSASLANPRGGTVPGGHWVEFAFDQVYPLVEMWIWNFNENTLFDGEGDGTDYPVDTWTAQGMREVTIQSTAVGGGGGGTWGSDDPADWATVFTGEIPQAHGRPAEPVSLVVDFAGIAARYVVVTTSADASRLNWATESGFSGITDTGLSEIRFYRTAPNEGTVLFVR